MDAVSFQGIEGWAWDPNDPYRTVSVEIYDGQELLLRIPATQYREDLRDAGIGTGNYGFRVPNPSVLLPLVRHRIAVRRATDGVDLPGSPQWIQRQPAELDSSIIQLLVSVCSPVVGVTYADDDLDKYISVTQGVLNELLISRNRDGQGVAPICDHLFQDALLSAKVSAWTQETISKVETSYLPIHFNDVDDPAVSIVIPASDRFHMTYNCLKSISENRPKCSFEVILCDAGSHDETPFAGFKLSGAIRVIRGGPVQERVCPRNAGAAAARGKFLLFLGNNTLVRPNWLDELVWTFENVPDVGITGSRLLFENGAVQETGGIIWRLGDRNGWGRGQDSKKPQVSHLRDCDDVSGSALMIERDLFNDLSGFDDQFTSSNFADTDLCFRVRAMGRRVVVQPASDVVRLEGCVAESEDGGPTAIRQTKKERRRFCNRWRASLSNHRFAGEQPEIEVERTVNRRVLFVDDRVLTPDQDAGSNAALQHMLALMRLGYKITFIPAATMMRVDPYTLNLEKLGIECLHAPHCSSTEEAFRGVVVSPDLIYLHRYSNASKYASLSRQYFPSCFLAYNVADLHYLRQQRERQIEGALTDAAPVSRDAEIAAMRAVDAVIVHSSVEAKLLRSVDATLMVHVVPWTVVPNPAIGSFKDRTGYAFVGGYGHRPNVDAARYLALEIAPRVNEVNPRIQGFLVGANAPTEVVSLGTKYLQVTGFVPDLTELMHKLRCTVAPLRYGAGLKGKILDSFAHGIPCVMSEVAAEGFDLPRELRWLVARTRREFAQKIISIHDDERLNRKISEHALNFVRQKFCAEIVDKRLAQCLRRDRAKNQCALE